MAGSTSGTADLTFGAPTGATNVIAQQKGPSDAGFVTAVTASSITAASTSATVVDLVAGDAYDIQLQVTGGDKAGTSNTVTVTPA